MPAKHQINLSPRRAITQTPAGKFLQWALTYGRYIIIGTEIVVLLAFIARFKLDRDRADLREEIAQKEAIVSANHEFEEEIRHIQNRLTQIKALKTDQKKMTTILGRIEQQTPPEVTFSSLTLNDTEIKIAVHTLSTAGLTQFITNLRLSPFFTKVIVDRVQQQETGIIFSVSAQLKQNP